MKYFIFGATGFFGSRIKNYLESLGETVVSTRVDVRDYQAVFDKLLEIKPDVVINSAGITGRPNVDWCEDNKEDTMLVNVNGAINVISASAKLNIYPVHIGSGCIYEGDSSHAFTEDDLPNFYGSFYSRTKLYSEALLKEFKPLQLRVRIPIEAHSSPKNVIDKLLKYEKVVSIDNSFTIIEDFLPAMHELVKRGERGVYNMTNESYMDHKFLMENYREIVDSSRSFTYMTHTELNQVTKAKRSNCILDTRKRESLGIKMPNIKARVIEILKLYKQNLS